MSRYRAVLNDFWSLKALHPPGSLSHLGKKLLSFGTASLGMGHLRYHTSRGARLLKSIDAEAIGYTAGPAPLKYLGLGDLTVLICFGPGITAYSIAVLIGPLPWPQLACAMLLPLPAAFYVVAILHANNYRDIEVDKQAGGLYIYLFKS